MISHSTSSTWRVMLLGAFAPTPGLAVGTAELGTPAGDVWLLAGGIGLGAATAMLLWWALNIPRDRRDRIGDRHWRSLLTLVDCMIWEAEVRQDGTALHWHFTLLQPFKLYRRLLGTELPRERDYLWLASSLPDLPAMDARSSQAILSGAAGYEQDHPVLAEGTTFWLHETVAIEPDGPGRWHLVGVVTDVTARHAADAARRSSEQQMERLMAQTHALLWQARVTAQPSGHFHWELFLPRSELYRLLFLRDPGEPQTMFWGSIGVPEADAMTVRARDALERNLPGYEQEFHVPRPGGDIWLHEQVSITSADPGHWTLSGVIVDISARRAAEEAQRAQQAHLAHMLEKLDCILWRARVVEEENGNQSWSLFIPASRLYREVFGEDPGVPSTLRWERVVDAATDEAMKARAQRALRSGERSYVQEFCAQRAGRACWLHEQVAIIGLGAYQWDLVGVLTDVTPRHEVEQVGRAHQEQLDKIFEVVDCLLWRAEVTEVEGGEYAWLVFVTDSKLYHRLFGPELPEPHTALNWDRANVPEYSEMGQRSAAAIRSGARGYEQEFRAYVDGQMYWMFERAAITRVAYNRWDLVGVVVDVTARRLAEQEVRSSEQRYRTLFQHTPVAMVETDFSAAGRWLEGLRDSGVADLDIYLAAHPRELLSGVSRVRVVDCNDMAVGMLCARSKGDLQLRRRWLAVAETMGVVRGIFVALAQGRNTYEAEMQIRDFSGRRRQMLMRWWIGQSAAGVDLQRSVLVLVDLTDLKRAEAELAAEKERLAVTLRAMAESVITTDTAGRVQFANPAAVALTRWESEDAAGRAVDEVCPLRHADTGAAVPIPVAQVLGGDRVAELPARTVLVDRTGEQRLVEGCCAPIHSAASKVVGIVLVLRDTTERERLEQEVLRASKLESVGLLAGGIAHDFNNILTAVMGNLTLAQFDVDPQGELGHTLREAEGAALRARDLTQQLLTFAKGGDPVRTAVHLPEMLEEVTRFALHGSRVKAEFDLASDLWPADADKGQIGRVVQNLVINAVQAMPAGGVVRLLARNEQICGLDRPPLLPGNYVHIAVSDAGVGIKGEHLDHIFEPYFTTKQTGSGLGLATVYSIVRKHKGLIQVESALGRGTTFHVRLPAAAMAGPDAPVEAAVAGAKGGLRGRVLFMDDEAPIRRMATAMLRRLGCEVELAADGEAAVVLHRTERETGRAFDVVIMDLTVPGGMGGLEALQRMRATDPQVKAIVSSGYSSDPVLANFRTYGFSGRVAKPYEIADFARVLREVLGAG